MSESNVNEWNESSRVELAKDKRSRLQSAPGTRTTVCSAKCRRVKWQVSE